jgi:hypothetical protein
MVSYQGGGGGGVQVGAVRPMHMNPNEWPIGVKQYVERCFRLCKPSQRDVLQAALRLVIHDAQSKGELYSRRWETLPIPDVNQRPQDAASVVIKFSNYYTPAPPVGAVRPMAKPTMVRIDTKKRPVFNTEEIGRPRKISNVSQGGAYADDEVIRRQQRAGRFKEDKGKKKKTERKPKQVSTLKGTCKNIEKSYFRLTSAPDPSSVRPEPVLRKALHRLIGLIASGDVNYFYSQDQFKGMRQDCVVQALKGDIAVDIYEAHARAALEYGDMAEYNQCQGQLRYLYSKRKRHNPEFVAYRILYQSIFSYSSDKSELVGLLESMSILDDVHHEKSREIVHALQVRKSLVSHNYALFFKLYESAPALGRALMDIAVPKMRFACLKTFVIVFKPTLSVDFVCKTLGFAQPSVVIEGSKKDVKLPGCSTVEFEGAYRGVEDDQDALRECIEWLKECNAVIVEDDIDCKLSLSSIKMPEEKHAVAHGDANLDIADFFK